MNVEEQTKNDVPRGWVLARIDEIAEVNPALPIYSLLEDMEVSFLPMKAVEEESGHFDPTIAKKFVEVRKGYTPFIDGDVIFAKITPCMENGKAAVVSRLINGIGFGSTEFHVMRVEPQVMFSHFLFFFVVQRTFRKEAQAKMTGSAGQKRVPTVFIQHSTIPVPPIAEQHRIVAKIEELFTRLDAGVASLKQAKAQLKRYRQAVLKAAVEGELTREWREQHKDELEPASVLLERILKERREKWEADQLAKMKAQGKVPKDDKWKEKYQEPDAPDRNQLQLLPQKWECSNIDQLSIVVRGASPRPAGDPKYFGGEIPWITVGALTAKEQPYLHKVDETVTEAGCSASRYIEPHTLLLTNSGATLGVPKITLIAGCINDGSVALLHVDYPIKLYLYYFLKTQTKKLRRINQGAAQPNLNTGIVKSILTPLPPLAEQEMIVTEVERRLSVADEIAASLDTELKRAERLRQSILMLAFEGKLVPQDPNDEPASVLLERIKAEKAQRESQSSIGKRFTRKRKSLGDTEEPMLPLE